MVSMQNISSLNLVRHELDATLNQAQASLEAWNEAPDVRVHLEQATEALHQITGVMSLVGLAGTNVLAAEMEALCRRLLEGTIAGEGQRELAALSNGLMILGRYLEYVQVRQQDLPPLLVPAINELRRQLLKHPIVDSSFVEIDVCSIPPLSQSLSLSPAEWQATVRRLRHMYQIGLLAVLRAQEQVVHLRFMKRALDRLDALSAGQAALHSVLWTAVGALEALEEGISLNALRRQSLAQIDRLLKVAVYEGAALAGARVSDTLIRDLAYLAALSNQSQGRTLQVREHFALLTQCPGEERIKEEYEGMCGPGGSVIRTVADVIREELARTKDTLDLYARGATDAAFSFGSVAADLARMSQTLMMLGLPQASDVIRQQSEQVAAYDDQTIDPAGDMFQQLVYEILNAENAVQVLVRQSEGDVAVTEGSTISLNQLDEARALVVAESRSGLSLAKRAITSYIESNFDVMHLTNVPATLNTVAGGLAFLFLPRAGEIIKACVRFTESRLLDSDIPPPAANLLETFADALMAVDYYLESMEANKPIGDSVLEIAEYSMQALGVPVVNTAAPTKAA